MDGWIDWTKTSQSPNYRGSHSFATFMIVAPTCFFLGILFAGFPYDYPLLWSSHPVSAAYYDQLEAHLRFINASPPLISRLMHIAIAITILGFALKLAPGTSQENFLFDGAALIMFVIGMGVYFSNIVKGLHAVKDRAWESTATSVSARDGSEIVLGREDTFRMLATSDTILALILVGVLVLQTGQWYAERKEHDDLEKIAAERRDARAGSGGGRRKQ